MRFEFEEVSYTDGSFGIKVRVSLRAGFRTHWIELTGESASPMERDFVFQALRDQFHDHITAIRRAAYEQGWRDKTKRRRKQVYFDYCANVRAPWSE